jgi:hypothetical protein
MDSQVLKSVAEFYTILLEVHLQVASEMLRGGNLFLTLVSKTDHSGSVMFKSGECTSEGRCWSSPSWSSNHDWTDPAVWMWALPSWETASLFGNDVWIMGCTRLPNLSTYSLVVSDTAVKGNNGTNKILYHGIAAQATTEPSFCFTVGTRHSGVQPFLGVLQT